MLRGLGVALTCLKSEVFCGQFWYTDETANHVARECVEAAGPSGRIACIACPSLFRQLRAHFPDAHAHLFEVDLRFEVGKRQTASACREWIVLARWFVQLAGVKLR